MPTLPLFKFIILLVLILGANPTSAQIDESTMDFSASFMERPKFKSRASYLDTKIDRSNYVSQVLNSGKVVYSGASIDYLQSLVNKLSDDQEELIIYMVNSNEVGLFSDQNRLFITSGLIAQCFNEDQISFFIAREIEKVIGQFPTEFAKKTPLAMSYDEKIKLLISENDSSAIALDVRAMNRFKRNQIPTDNVKACYNILRYSNLPYDFKEVPVDYLNSEKMFVPPIYFLAHGSKRMICIDTAFISQLDKREKKLSDIGLVETMKRPRLEPSIELSALFRESRFEYLNQTMIRGEFEFALYTIFLLEDAFGTSDELDAIKVNAWYGLGLREMSVLPKMSRLYYVRMQCSGVTFFATLRRFPTGASVALGARMLYDYKQSHPDFEMIWTNYLSRVREFPYIKMEDFSKSTYFEAFRNGEEKLNTLDKYDYLEAVSSDTMIAELGDSIAKFYFYGLSDIVSQDSFWSELETARPHRMEEGKSIGVYPTIFCVRKFENDEVKSTKKMQLLINEFDEIPNSSLAGSIAELNYGLQCELKELFSQHYFTSGYNVPMPVLSDTLKAFVQNQPYDYVVIPFYQSAKRLKWQGFHFLGVFIAPLPFVIPDLLLKINQSSYFTIIFSTKTAEIIHCDYTNYYEPLTTKNMIDRLQHSILESQTMN